MTSLPGFVVHLAVQVREAEIYFAVQRGSFHDLADWKGM